MYICYIQIQFISIPHIYQIKISEETFFIYNFFFLLKNSFEIFTNFLSSSSYINTKIRAVATALTGPCAILLGAPSLGILF